MEMIERNIPASRAAAAVGYSPRYLVILARKGKVPATLRAGSRWFFNVEELKSFFGMVQPVKPQ